MNEGVIFEALKKLDCIKDECVGDLSISCGCYQVLRALRDAERERCRQIAEDMQLEAARAKPSEINNVIEATARTIAASIRTGT